MLCVYLICKYVISITINAKQRASRRILSAVWTSAHTETRQTHSYGTLCQIIPIHDRHSTGTELAQYERLFDTLKRKIS